MCDRSRVWRCLLCFVLAGWLLLRCDSITNAQSLATPQASQGATQTASQNASPTIAVPVVPSVEQRLGSLEYGLASQAENTKRLEGEVDDLKPLGVLNRWLLGVAVIFGAAIGFIGAKELVRTTADKIVTTRITERLNRVDPSGMRVYVHNNLFNQADSYKQALLYDVLQRLGLKPEPFGTLNDLTDKIGCVVYGFKPDTETPPGDRRTPTKSPDEAPFVEFLKNLGRQRADTMGFVIYSPFPVQVSDDVPSAFPIVTYANTVVTIGTNVLTIARCLAPNITDRGSGTPIR